MKSLERRLYEAIRKGVGIRLSADDVDLLVSTDTAIETRIANAAASEVGGEEPGYSEVHHGLRLGLTWKQLGELHSGGK